MNNTIGIIGGGFVGSATAWAFRPTHEVKIYDKDPKASTHTFEEAIGSDFIFICVPTPPKEDWTTDLSIVEGIFEKLKPHSCSQQILIKSTVLPGTCRRMSEKYKIKVN